ncbi:MAG TPA: flagellar motor switch protein FliM [Candidatus Acidoferrales bacterium]|nr:flagellar motor switch protein FliM [Candidatus Acidoferrales bacterium]
MPEVLSQSEIDSLLAGIGKESPAETKEAVQKEEHEVQGFDFRRPNRVSKNQLRILQAVHETFAELFSFYLASKLQTQVSISVSSVDQLFYSEYQLSIGSPTCLYVFNMENAEGRGVLEFSPTLVFAIVERLLGGGAAEPNRKLRAVTEIEKSLVKTTIDKALSDLQNAWRSISNLKFKLERFESEADFLQIAPASEIVLIVSFDVQIANTGYLMNVCFPTFSLEDIIQRLNLQYVAPLAGGATGQRMKSEATLKNISTTELPVSVILGKSMITLRDLIGLQMGDVIILDSKRDGLLPVKIASRTKFFARVGVHDDHKAVKIVRTASEEEQNGE